MDWEWVGASVAGPLMLYRLIQGEYVQAAIIPAVGALTKWMGETSVTDLSDLWEIVYLGDGMLVGGSLSIPGGLIGRVTYRLGGETLLSAAIGAFVGTVVSCLSWTEVLYPPQERAGFWLARGFRGVQV